MAGSLKETCKRYKCPAICTNTPDGKRLLVIRGKPYVVSRPIGSCFTGFLQDEGFLVEKAITLGEEIEGWEPLRKKPD